MSKDAQELSKIIQNKKKLIETIQSEFQDIFEWLESNGVDLATLGKYAKSFAAIAIISFSLHIAPIDKRNPTFASEQKEIHFIKVSSDQLVKLNKDEFRALKVWNTYAPEINSAAAKYNIEREVIFATIMVESGGNPDAVRYEPHLNDSSYGLGQILYSTAVHIGHEGSAKELYSPATNIDLIGRYHRWNIDAFGNLETEKIATAYNAGNPYNTPTYGYLDKFNKWYDLINKLEKI